mmetsp:Transcript_9093/g.6443  ORF Transcript_9093/g.6443 Transcript_9093/m.6443 type:complete len:96 (-) Transcript_9093:893-1180(-)
MNLFKLYFGTACLTVPNIFSKTGWLGGSLLLGVVGIINCYTMWQMIEVVQEYPRVRTYSQLADTMYGKTGKLLLDISIWSAQLTCGISYMYFIST